MEKIIKQQSRLNFNQTQKIYTNYDNHTFEQNDFLMDKPIYLGFLVLKLSKLLMYKTYYDILQQDFGDENMQWHYIDTDSFVLCKNTNIKSKDLKNLKDFLTLAI